MENFKRDLEKCIEKSGNKLDLDVFEEEVELLRIAINQSSATTQTGKNPNPISGGKAQPNAGLQRGMTVAEKTKMKET